MATAKDIRLGGAHEDGDVIVKDLPDFEDPEDYARSRRNIEQKEGYLVVTLVSAPLNLKVHVDAE